MPPSQLEETDSSSSSEGGVSYPIIIGIVCAAVLLMGCACFCCYRHRKGKESRAVHMRRNLGYTPDMEAKGEGNFGPTNKHVAITRGGGPQVTPEMLATTSYSQPTHPPTHQRAPSEAPSSIIEDNIANNYRPKTAAKVRLLSKEDWFTRRMYGRKDLGHFFSFMSTSVGLVRFHIARRAVVLCSL